MKRLFLLTIIMLGVSNTILIADSFSDHRCNSYRDCGEGRCCGRGGFCNDYSTCPGYGKICGPCP